MKKLYGLKISDSSPRKEIAGLILREIFEMVSTNPMKLMDLIENAILNIDKNPHFYPEFENQYQIFSVENLDTREQLQKTKRLEYKILWGTKTGYKFPKFIKIDGIQYVEEKPEITWEDKWENQKSLLTIYIQMNGLYLID
jgi:hypothetical protein